MLYLVHTDSCSGSGEKDFSLLSMYFGYFTLRGKECHPSFEKFLNLLDQKCFVFGRNWSHGSRKEDDKVKSLKTDRRRTTSISTLSLHVNIGLNALIVELYRKYFNK